MSCTVNAKQCKWYYVFKFSIDLYSDAFPGILCIPEILHKDLLPIWFTPTKRSLW